MRRLSLELDFPVTYDIEQLGHINRSDGRQAYSYPDADRVDQEQKLGDRPILGITPETGEPWIGVFYGGGYSSPLAAPSQLIAWPDRRSFCIVHEGGAVVVRADAPQETYTVDVNPVLGVTVVPRKRLVVFADYQSLTAYGVDGLVWRSGQLVLDDLRVEAVEGDALVLRGYFGGGGGRFTVDLATGAASGYPWQRPT